MDFILIEIQDCGRILAGETDDLIYIFKRSLWTEGKIRSRKDSWEAIAVVQES